MAAFFEFLDEAAYERGLARSGIAFEDEYLCRGVGDELFETVEGIGLAFSQGDGFFFGLIGGFFWFHIDGRIVVENAFRIVAMQKYEIFWKKLYQFVFAMTKTVVPQVLRFFFVEVEGLCRCLRVRMKYSLSQPLSMQRLCRCPSKP